MIKLSDEILDRLAAAIISEILKHPEDFYENDQQQSA